MEAIKLQSTTIYFAIKKSITKAIDIFKRDGFINEIRFESGHENGKLDILIKRSTINRYLGYDFKTKHVRLRNEYKKGGKLANKVNILVLHSKIINDMFENNKEGDLAFPKDFTVLEKIKNKVKGILK